MIEITVKVSGDDTTLTEKFLIHEEGMKLSHDDDKLRSLVDSVTQKFKGIFTDVLVKIKYTW